MNPLTGEIIIKDWQNGIGASPHMGFALIKSAEIDSFPGSVRAGKLPVSEFPTAFSQVVTADPATEILTAAGGTVPVTGTAVQISNSGGALPTGLSANTNYFVINLGGLFFRLATTIANANAGTAINITGAGSGTNTVATVTPGTINHQVYDPRAGTIFAIDSNGRVWYSEGSLYMLLGGNTLTNASGQGLVVFRTSDGTATYLFAFRNASIDVVNVFGTSQKEAPSWTNSWQSMNTGAGSSNSHKAIVGQDNIIYFTDDRYIGSIVEKAGSVFDPSNAATYTYNNQALDLPLGSLCYWLEQLGVNLLISVSNDGYIYPWDRSSDSYGLPIPIGEYGGNKMKNIGNMVYILAGTRGNIYWTQGTYVKLFKQIPLYLTNNSGTRTSSPVTWGGIESMLGELLVGVGAFSGQSGTYRFTADGRFTIDSVPSTGAARTTSIIALNDFYHTGYAGGGDYFSGSNITSTGCVIQSALYRVGDHTSKAKFSQIEVQCGRPVSGSIILSWRRNLTASWTPLTTITTSSGDTSPSYQLDCGLTDIENVQVQAEFGDGQEILQVSLHP